MRHELQADRSRLNGILAELQLAQGRLARLEAWDYDGQQALARQLISDYELGRGDFAGAGSFRLIARVRAARAAQAAQAVRLGALSLQRSRLEEVVLEEHERFLDAEPSLASSPPTAVHGWGDAERSSAQPAGSAAAAISGAGGRTGFGTGPSAGAGTGAVARTGAGAVASPRAKDAGRSLPFPMPDEDAAPAATWSLAGGGVDIAAPDGTPELAVCAGTIVLHGVGGLGPSTPVLHCDTPIAGHAYVYYGHAGAGRWTPVGTHVTSGQVISEVGAGIVGQSTGPNLDIGFSDPSGSPFGRTTAQDLMKLLRTAYHR